MEDQICSPQKYRIKNSYNKNIFYLNEKKNVVKTSLTDYKFIFIA